MQVKPLCRLGAAQVQVEAEDVRAERLRVEALLQKDGSPFAPAPAASTHDGSSSLSHSEQAGAAGRSGHSIIVQDLWKVFPPMGGNG
jgi:hypothetical protein